MVFRYLIDFECIDDSGNSDDDDSCSNQGYCSSDGSCQCNSIEARDSKFGGQNCSGKFFSLVF